MSNKKRQIGYIIHEAVTESETKIINENGSRVSAETILQDADTENRNGRCYRLTDLTREVNCPRTKELIDAKELKCELSHPTDPSIIRQQVIDAKLCCARIDKIWMDGNFVKGIVRGTNNAYGQEFDLDLREGGKKAWSLRALGSILTEKGRNYVDNLRMITYDQVIYPSHKVAYTTKVLTESAGMGSDKIYVPNNEGIIIPITNESVISYIKSESANLKNVFNTFDTLCESIAVVNNGKDVRLVAKSGDILMINLESYIQNEIMDYCTK